MELVVGTDGAGTYDLTDRIAAEVRRSGVADGLVTVFCRHTSCSLVIFENADPSARADLVHWLDRLVPADDPAFTHTAEGPDDMPAHLKMALTRTSETIPVVGGQMALGEWQGLFLWEHRAQPHRRRVAVAVMGLPLAGRAQ